MEITGRKRQHVALMGEEYDETYMKGVVGWSKGNTMFKSVLCEDRALTYEAFDILFRIAVMFVFT